MSDVREYDRISDLPDLTLPMTGEEYYEVERGLKSYKIKKEHLGGIPEAHAATHKPDGVDPIATQDRTANAIPATDGDGTLNAFMDDASVTKKGLAVLAAHGGTDTGTVMQASDPRGNDARTPKAHAASHLGGGDPLGLKGGAFLDADVPGGLPLLGADQKLPTKYIPPIAITDVLPVASQEEMLALTAERGDIAVRTDLSNTAFILCTDDPTIFANWIQLSPGSYVISVDGLSGVVSLKGKYIGLWSAQSYPVANWVYWGNKIYFSSTSTMDTEIPGESPVWIPLSGSGADYDIGYDWKSGQFDTSIGEWVVYYDGDVAEPIDGLGGSIDWETVVEREIDTTIISTGSLLFRVYRHANENKRGYGISAPLKIEGLKKGRPSQFTFSYKTVIGDVANYYGVFLIDSDNGGTLPLSISTLNNTDGNIFDAVATFIPKSNATNYRLCFHIISTAYAVDAWSYLKIANIQLGAQHITQGAAISGSIKYDPVITGIPAGSTVDANYCIQGTKIAIQIDIVLSGAVTSDIAIPIPTQYTPKPQIVALKQVGSAFGHDNGVAYYNGVVRLNPAGSMYISGNATGQGWNVAVPFTWGAGDQLSLQALVEVNQLSATVGLVQNYAEFVSNSTLTAVTDQTGTNNSYSPSGTLLQNFAPTGTNAIIKRVKFQHPFMITDEPTLEVIPGSGIPISAKDYGFCFQQNDASTIYYGTRLIQVDAYTIDVYFFSAPFKGSTWAGFTGVPWRVRKTSAGKPGETLPMVRAEYKSSAASSASANIIFSTKVDDTNSCYNTTTGEFTVLSDSVIRASGNVLCGTTVPATFNLVVKRSGSTIQTKVAGYATVASSRVVVSGSVRVKAGDVISLTSDQATVASATADITFETIGR